MDTFIKKSKGKKPLTRKDKTYIMGIISNTINP